MLEYDYREDMPMFFKSYFNKFNIDDKDFSYKESITNTFDYSNIENDGFIVQGFCCTDKYYLVSAYYHSCSVVKNSRVYFYDREKGQSRGYVVLDNKAHVGGMAYDSKNRLIYITGSGGKINVYKYDSLVSSLDGNCLEKINSDGLDISKNLNGNVSAATIYYYDNSLYVATCSCKGNIVQYYVKYLADVEKIVVVDIKTYNCLPACIQGLIVFMVNDKKYFLISQSYSKLKSLIKLFDFDMNFLGQKIIGFSGLEGIDMDRRGNIHGVFEYGITSSYVINICKLDDRIHKVLEYKYLMKGQLHQKKLDNIK